VKVLIVEDEVEILELLKFSVEIDLAGSEIHTATGGRQAIELLEANKDFDLVICDYSMPEVSGDKVQAFIKKTSPSTKFVLCSAYTDSDKLEIDDDFLYFRITKPGITDGVKELIKMLEKPTGQEQAYIPIATSLLEKIGVAPCDIYIKLGDEKAQDSKAALGSFQKQINLLFENISSEEGAQKSVEINEFMFETAKEIGINQEVIDLGKPAIVFATNLIKKQPELKKAILKIYQDKRAYIPQHSVCTSFISCFIASKMSWASELTSCKLALASMLHDIEIDNPELIEYTVWNPVSFPRTLSNILKVSLNIFMALKTYRLI
jgi:CheY-like chemotaxis protein